MSELSTTLSAEEAKAITQQIRDAVENTWVLLKRAFDGNAAEALGYANWEGYVQAEFQMSRRHADRLVNFAEVRELLGPTGPTSERQARPLDGLPPEKQRAAWERAKEATGSEQPPSAAVEEAAEAVEADEVIPPSRERTPTYQPASGLMYADNAISQLKKIHDNDTQRTRAFERVMQWIAGNK